MKKINIYGIEYDVTDDMFIEKEAIRNCVFKDCLEHVFLIFLNKDYAKQTIMLHLDSEKDKKQIEKLNELLKINIVLSNFKLCKKHINETYNPIIEVLNKKTSNFNSKDIKIKTIEEKNVTTFSKFPFKNMSDFFAYKTNDRYCNEIFSDLFENQDNLRKSIIKKLIVQLNITEEELHKTGINNSEFIWFLNNHYYSSILIHWRKNFVLEQYIGKDNNQGKLHGPDFIFKDTKTNKTYGFEILELNKNFFVTPKGIKDIKKFLESIGKQIEKRGGTLENYLKTTKLEIDKKIDKWKNYQKTDYKYIGIIVNQSWPEEWYFIFDLLMNSIYGSDGLTDGIIFL